MSAAAYNSVLEGNTDSTDGLRELCARYYHGFNEDNIGVAASFLQGDRRSGVLWDDDVIAPGFGHLSGLSHAQLSYYILRPTLKGKSLITGRQILEKARACLMEAKKMLALWIEFLIDGQMPSGMNEDNALQHVLKRSHALTSNEVVEEDVNGEDLDDQGDQGASGKNFFIIEFCMHFNILFDIWMFSQSPLMLLYFQIKSVAGKTLAKFNSSYTLLFIDDDENDNESDDEEEYVKEKKVVKKEIPQSLNNFYLACTLFFILYGPYGVLAHNFDNTPCLSIDSKGIDEQAKRYKNMPTTHQPRSK